MTYDELYVLKFHANPTVDKFRSTHIDYLKTIELISYKLEQNLRDMRKDAESYFENKNNMYHNNENKQKNMNIYNSIDGWLI